MFERFGEEIKEPRRDRQDQRGAYPMPQTIAHWSWSVREQPQHGGDDRHGVPTGALPATAAQVQPHAELAKPQPQPDTVEHAGQTPICGRLEQQVAPTAASRKMP